MGQLCDTFFESDERSWSLRAKLTEENQAQFRAKFLIKMEFLVGAWGFEPQTPTVSIHSQTPRITRNAFLQREN